MRNKLAPEQISILERISIENVRIATNSCHRIGVFSIRIINVTKG
jgi:hypothetical protein